MIDTRLVFVDGLSGSRKSTTAHWLARQMRAAGLEADWLHEEEEGHPLAWATPPGMEGATELEKRERYLLEQPGRWRAWAETRASRGGTTIAEGHFLMASLMPLIARGFPRARIEAFALSLWEALAPLDPVLVAFWQRDVPAAFRLNWKRRGPEWEAWYLGRLAASDYARTRGMDGAQAAFSIGETFMDCLRSIVGRIEGPKLLLEIGDQDWPRYRAEILAFLGLEPREECQSLPGEEAWCGAYRGSVWEEESSFEVRKDADRLRLDAFWPDLALLPRGPGLYEIEGFPFTLRFTAEAGGAARLDFTDGAKAGSRTWTLRRGPVPSSPA